MQFETQAACHTTHLQNIEFGSELKYIYSNNIFWIKAERTI